MGLINITNFRNKERWYFTIAMVLCTLFFIAIAVKAFGEFKNLNRVFLDDLRDKTQFLSQKLDNNIISAKNLIIANNNKPAIEVSSSLLNAPSIETMAVFSAEGALIDAGTQNKQDISALYAAMQLATPEGWIGAVAVGNNSYSLAMSIKANNGNIVTALIKTELDFKDAIKNNQEYVITDGFGFIIDKSSNSNSRTITEELGIKIPKSKQLESSNYKTAEGVFISYIGTISSSGLWVFVTAPKSQMQLIGFKNIIFYMLLFMGPILGFSGMYIMSKIQSNKLAFARDKMKLAEKKLQLTLEGAKCGVWEWNIKEDTVTISKQIANLIGINTSGKLFTNEIQKFLSPNDQLRLRAELNNVREKKSMDIQLQFIPISSNNKIKKSVYLHFRGNVQDTESSKNKFIVNGVAIDVTEQILNQKRVIATEKRLKLAIESIRGPFAIWNKEQRLILWNDPFLSYFNLDKNEIEKGVSYLEVSKKVKSVIINQKQDKFDVDFHELELSNGSFLRYSERATPDGGLVSIGIDITIQKETEEDAHRSEQQLRSVVSQLQTQERESAELAKRYEMEKIRAEEASASKNTFLANMSHELRTPLNAINGFSQILSDQIYGPLGNPKYVGYAQDIFESGKHLLDLINDVLDMAKIEAGKFKIYPQRMSLNETIDQSLRVVRGRAEQKRILIETDYDDEDEIIGDSRAIKQIMINLVGNSIKFTEIGGRILLRTTRQGENILISVIDNGIGIAEENISRLGRAFEQVENEHARTNQGTGLGLALCRSFAEMHGGNMQITSKIGIGTKVDILLPVVSQYDQEEAA